MEYINDQCKEVFIDLELDGLPDTVLMTGFQLDGDPLTLIAKCEEYEGELMYYPSAVVLDEKTYNRLTPPRQGSSFTVFNQNHALSFKLKRALQSGDDYVLGIEDSILDALTEEGNTDFGLVYSTFLAEFPEIVPPVASIIKAVQEHKKKVVFISPTIYQFNKPFDKPVSILYPDKDGVIATDEIPYYDLAILVDEHRFSDAVRKLVRKELLIKANIHADDGTSVVLSIKQAFSESDEYSTDIWGDV